MVDDLGRRDVRDARREREHRVAADRAAGREQRQALEVAGVGAACDEPVHRSEHDIQQSDLQDRRDQRQGDRQGEGDAGERGVLRQAEDGPGSPPAPLPPHPKREPISVESLSHERSAAEDPSQRSFVRRPGRPIRPRAGHPPQYAPCAASPSPCVCRTGRGTLAVTGLAATCAAGDGDRAPDARAEAGAIVLELATKIE